MRFDLDDALAYVRENKTWSDAEEEVALEYIDRCRCPLDLVGSPIADEIQDLLEEYCEDIDVDRDTWAEYGSLDDYFFSM